MEEFSLNSFNLTDKVVLITGGASGLGQYYTQAVSKVGADVFIVSYDRQGWEETRAAVETNGRKAVFMLQDITEPGAAKKIVQQAMQEFGRIDALINNAGTVS